MPKISKTKFKKLEKECLEIIIEHNIIFIDEIFIFTEITPSLFEKFELNNSPILKDAIDINRAKLKRELRLKWLESQNATLNSALYKLICSEHEKRALSAASSSKPTPQNELCTQEEYLKSLKEMGETTENAD